MNLENTNIRTVCDMIGEPAVYEQLAEECSELAKAALKMARILRNENPTPVTQEQAFQSVKEEWVDVFLCLCELNIPIDYKTFLYKCARWRERIVKGGETSCSTVSIENSTPKNNPSATSVIL